jgi:hypothetical protein
VLQVHVLFETSSWVPFGTNGYRADCNHVLFSQVLVINHDDSQKAWFKRDAFNPVPIAFAQTNYETSGATFGLFTGYGAAQSSTPYQMSFCYFDPLSPGLMFSGVVTSTACPTGYKPCNSWCGDTTSRYFRTDPENPSFSGVAWNENGHGHLSNKLVSYGLRSSYNPQLVSTTAAAATSRANAGISEEALGSNSSSSTSNDARNAQIAAGVLAGLLFIAFIIIIVLAVRASRKPRGDLKPPPPSSTKEPRPIAVRTGSVHAGVAPESSKYEIGKTSAEEAQDL